MHLGARGSTSVLVLVRYVLAYPSSEVCALYLPTYNTGLIILPLVLSLVPRVVDPSQVCSLLFHSLIFLWSFQSWCVALYCFAGHLILRLHDPLCTFVF